MSSSPFTFGYFEEKNSNEIGFGSGFGSGFGFGNVPIDKPVVNSVSEDCLELNDIIDNIDNFSETNILKLLEYRESIKINRYTALKYKIIKKIYRKGRTIINNPQNKNKNLIKFIIENKKDSLLKCFNCGFDISDDFYNVLLLKICENKRKDLYNLFKICFKYSSKNFN